MSAGAAQVSAERYRRCLELQRRIGIEHDPDRLSQLVMAEVAALLGADRCTVFLFDWETMALRANFAEGLPGRSLVVPLRMGIVGTAILRRERTNISNAYAHPYFNAEIDSALGYKTDSLLVAPILTADGRVLGGLELINKRTGRFSAEDEEKATGSAARLARWFAEGLAYPAGVEAEVVALRNAVGCDRGTAFSLDMASGRLVAFYADGEDGRPLSLNLKLGIAGMVAVTGESVRIDDVWEDARFDRSVDNRTGYRSRSMLCVPLSRPFKRSADQGGGETVGVIQVINKHDGVFDAEDQSLLEAVAGPLAIALENARLFAETEKQFFGMVAAMTASIGVHDGDKLGHSDSTVERALAIGRVLGLPDEDLLLLQVSSALHDYGMIGVEASLIHKPGVLDPHERLVMERHAMLTEQLLHRIPLARKYRQVPVIAAAHHEHMDGGGYPRGLAGQEIPFLARIIAVADSFEAMIADRPYRKAHSRSAAWKLIEQENGRRFDPVVVAALNKTLAVE